MSKIIIYKNKNDIGLQQSVKLLQKTLILVCFCLYWSISSRLL